MNKILILAILFTFASCSSDEPDSVTSQGISVDLPEGLDTTIQEEIDTIASNIEYSSEAIFTDNLGWGYQIYQGGKLYIKQPHVPAVSGMKGFDSEEDALSVAKLAIYKLQNNIVPPTISIEELDSLGVMN